MAPPCAGSVFDSRGYTVLLTAAATNIYVRVYSDAYIYIYIRLQACVDICIYVYMAAFCVLRL
jgi:hypothetical protein